MSSETLHTLVIDMGSVLQRLRRGMFIARCGIGFLFGVMFIQFLRLFADDLPLWLWVLATCCNLGAISFNWFNLFRMKRQWAKLSQARMHCVALANPLLGNVAREHHHEQAEAALTSL